MVGRPMWDNEAWGMSRAKLPQIGQLADLNARATSLEFSLSPTCDP